MKKAVRKIAVVLILALLLNCSSSSMSFKATTKDTSTPMNTNATIAMDKKNLNNYSRDTRERFVASVALENNISYEEADKLEKEQSSSIPYVEDEYLRYKTVDKKAGRIVYGSINETVNITTEVRYVWNKVTDSLNTIEAISGSRMYMTGDSNCQLLGGEFNIYETSKSTRISRTTTATFHVDPVKITINLGIISYSKMVGGYNYTLEPETFFINIIERDLK